MKAAERRCGPHAARMREAVDTVLRAAGGVASRDELLRGVGRVAPDHEVRMGHLVAVYPRAYARPWDADDQHLHARAALASVAGDSAISHTTALCRRGLPIPVDQPVHVTAYQPRHPRGVVNRLVVHRTVLPLHATDLDGLPTVRPEIAAVTSWPLLRGPDQRAPLIAACRRRLVVPSVLYRTANQMTWIRGVDELRSLVGLLAAGCESELELWGYREVFAVRGLDHAVRQRVVRVGDEVYRLDMAYDGERVAVELDGRAYHASTQQWDRDIARDLRLATVGWQTVRLSHSRLTSDPEGCRRDVLAVLASRSARAW